MILYNTYNLRKISFEYLFIAEIAAGVIIDTMKQSAKINRPIFGFFASGYKINGDIQNNCMSTTKYHK